MLKVLRNSPKEQKPEESVQSKLTISKSFTFIKRAGRVVRLVRLIRLVKVYKKVRGSAEDEDEENNSDQGGPANNKISSKKAKQSA